MDLFQPYPIGSITVRNRFIRSATHEGMGDAEGKPTASLQKLYIRLARGGVGALVTGYAGVMQQGRSSFPGMLMMHDDSMVPAYRTMVDALHREGAPVIMQLAHCGRQTRSVVTGMKTVAPSALKDGFFSEDQPRELSEGEILAIVDAFAKAAVRARKAGFDGVQLHMSHGYLLSQFLSAHSNRRRDRWGGTLENRYRIVSEILTSIRRQTGDFPVLAKINGYDGMPGGMRIGEAVQVAEMLEKSGCQAVEISSGTIAEGFAIMRGPTLPVDALMEANFKFSSVPRLFRPLLKRTLPVFAPAAPEPLRCYNFDAARMVKAALSIPVIVVGGIHTLEEALAALEENRADFISMSRPFIIEPSIVNKYREGKERASKCTMCNYCTIMIEKEPLRCWNGRLPHHT